ncbi:hypothetical protein OG558_05245 [Kribbella sp. NBC_01510]|uniref:hypothetical protein n=1 Tax=Kribbella sp. NBC_01510 TaxID=2903581 RepID=UPI00386E087D
MNADSRPMPNWPRKLGPGEPDLVPLRAPPDRCQQLPHLVRREADPGVGDAQPVVGRAYVDPLRRTGIGGLAGRDRVDGVLQQLAQVHPGTAVQMVAQQVDDPLQVDLEVLAHHGNLRHARVGDCSLSVGDGRW